MSEQEFLDLGFKLQKSGAFSITHAVWSKALAAFRIGVKASRLLLPSEMEAVKRLICDKLQTERVNIEYDFKDAVKELEEADPDKVSEFIMKAWGQLNPELYPVIANCRFNAVCGEDEGFSVVLKASPQIINALSAERISAFKSKAAELWGVAFAVKAFADESINEIKAVDISGYTEKKSGAFTGAGIPAAVKNARQKSSQKNDAPSASVIYGKDIVKTEITPMDQFKEDTGTAAALGSIIDLETTETKNKARTIVKLTFTDNTNTLTVKLFPKAEQAPEVIDRLGTIKKKGDLILVRGNYEFDTFSRDFVLLANDIVERSAQKRMETYVGDQRRVELHLHTQSSTMDALTKVPDLINTAVSWGHKAIAITDHGVVHSLPEAMRTLKDLSKNAKKEGREFNFKVIFGCEGYLICDSTIHSIDEKDYTALAATASITPAGTSIYDIAAVKFDCRGNIIDRFRTPVDFGTGIPLWAVENCGLTEEDGEGAPDPAAAVEKLLEFVGDSVIVAYNESVMNGLASVMGSEDDMPAEYVDINKLDLNVHLDIKDYSMKKGCDPISGRYETVPEKPAAVNADDIMDLFLGMIAELKHRGVNEVSYWNRHEPDYKRLQRYHIILLAASLPGLKNLYKLVSYSHLQYFHKRPCIPKSLLNMLRGGILVGSACEAGELYRAVSRGKSEEEQVRIASWYDYLEIQPLANNMFMVDAEDSNLTAEDLRSFNKRIIEIGDELGKMTVATCDVHFLDPDDAIFRSILLHSQGFKDATRMTPLYLRTTEEMLEEFSYLGEERAKEVVITNPNRIADMCGEQLHPFLDEKFTYSPELPNAKEILQEMTLKEAHRRYGDPLPEIVQARLDKELRSIVGNGYSSLYMVAQKLVSKSLSDGYLVGSRGSVGSSFVATMLGITEVNALPPHYLCPNCKYSEFMTEVHSRCGIDLPDKDCPVCGTKLRKEGYDIPFEVFLGFKGDKTPDIDLNFSGDYQSVAHHFTEEMFGEGHAFRAGTISGVQDKTVYGYVKHYCEDLGLNKSEPEINRLVQGCLGVKKTSGQHPGGIVIVPEDYEIFDFCPVQHPADKNDAGSVTTHFDFHALDDRLVKLDILGHDDPTVLRMLKDLTGLDPRTIPLDDKETMSIYSSDKALGVSLEKLGCDVGSLAIPEFGTNFVRGMLIETRPTTMEELVRISGLSHGTDVWNNNAQVLVENGTATLMEVICTRDDIMNYLISVGGDPSLSFSTMESVRKGRGLKPEMEEMMHERSVPEWFIDSCKKIKYMFPRAHAAAYVMMSFRIAYYKVHYPLEFYAVYFTVRADTFDIQLCRGGFDAVYNNIKLLKAKDKLDQKEKDAITILEVVAEMNLRGFELLPVDIYKSKAKTFVIEDGKIRPPFTSVAGLGENVAMLIEKAAENGEYLSKEDFAYRTKANTAIMEKLDSLGCFESLPDTDQISFSF